MDYPGVKNGRSCLKLTCNNALKWNPPSKLMSMFSYIEDTPPSEVTTQDRRQLIVVVRDSIIRHIDMDHMVTFLLGTKVTDFIRCVNMLLVSAGEH